MKKYMIAAATLLLIAGVSNAQVAQKTAAKTTAAKQAASAKAATVTNKAISSTAVVSPTPAKKNAASATIKRKHYHKKMKTEVKTGEK